MTGENEILFFETEDKQVKLPVNVENGSVWLNQNQIAKLFDRDIKTIGKYISTALKEEFADVKQRLKKYELFKPTYEGAVPGNPGTAPPVIQLYSPAQSTGQFHQRNDR